MKKYIIYLLLALAVSLSFSSCKKFLSESSQDEIKPTTTDDLASLLYSDAYPYGGIFDTYTDLLTDDIQSNGVPQLNGAPISTYLPFSNNGTPIYSWSPYMFDNISGTAGSNISDLLGVNSWSIYYGKIKGCNVVLDYINSVSGTAQVKNAITGQALFLRAFYYLKLVTLYGQPYSGTGIDPTKSLGVPLVLSSKVSDVYPARNTLAEVYKQIETDLLTAADLLKNNYTATSVFRVGHLAAYTLLSRLYLYMGRDRDMDNVILYANNALAIKPNVTQLSSYFTSATFLSAAGIYDQALSQEVIWSYGTNQNTNIANFYVATSNVQTLVPPFTVSSSLLGMYNQGTGTTNMGDLRYTTYFIKYASFGYVSRTGKIGSQAYGAQGIRVSELYLNRAEACIRRYMKTTQAGDLTQAISDLNYLRQNRYDTRNTAYVPVSFTDASLAFKFLQDERRRELCLEENFRWVDIKRWGLAVSHNYTDPYGSVTTYNLSAGSNLIYALPIPYDVVARNYNLQQNPR
ncbi:SusD-like starch-binding protein associating with outer membrane [Mucilaginibacter gracilis]|uniref:SusD-like starch-binding protein associating with outer membrane n=1 Tax=Mucilaginibacter gracilis TaxID=423350 RepID=A0A495J9E4_9SPHI|nr:RagB/SusD family nutrient uptake outer membrane protein [Mucilaginibacter gracilis]RKR85098.1 SusD-like starch-binding protein associating with outer membrane [Mucilaginibacter gracilis]